MIDIKVLRNNPEIIEASLQARGASIDLQEILNFDTQRKEIIQEVESHKKTRNEVSSKIGKGLISGDEKQQAIQDVRVIGDKIKEGDAQLRDLDEKIRQGLLCIPNILHEDTPVGKSENDNPEIKKWGKIPEFSFEPKHHADLGAALNIFDAPRGVKIAQSRFTLLKKAGAQLERALINFMLDVHTTEHTYEEVLTPFLANSTSMTATGQLPKFGDDMFKTEDDLYLIPTAEVPITNIHRDEILQEKELPIYYVGYTPCFRREAGSYGKDTKGYIRQHQFNKVEMVKFVHPENSLDELDKLLVNAETILQKLELPYRVVALCSGDIGFGAAKCYDIEVWLPSENRYREISSCSNFLDFQARRANIKFKPKAGGKPQLVHTINGSGLAVGRTLLAVLENYQQEDGSIKIPKILISYMKGLTEIAKLNIP
ncbi:MAG: seryl-tRNA synthetase [bacterium]|jgi:seryl-tRNA synthetase